MNLLSTPPPPNISKAPSFDSIAPPQGGPMGHPGAQAPQAPQAPQMPPAPTHEQTVAAMRHFQAIQDEIEPLLKDPDVGRSDMKSKVIDGATKLVAARIFTPADAVPFEQRNWLIRHHFLATVALHQVLDHHGAAVAAGMVPAGGKPKRENHIQDMAALKEHYKNG
jgi:hypothetical protein